MLVDTGATTFRLPTEVIQQLGLNLLREVPVATATRTSTARVFQDTKINFSLAQGVVPNFQKNSSTKGVDNQ